MYGSKWTSERVLLIAFSFLKNHERLYCCLRYLGTIGVDNVRQPNDGTDECKNLDRFHIRTIQFHVHTVENQWDECYYTEYGH